MIHNGNRGLVDMRPGSVARVDIKRNDRFIDRFV